MISRLLRRNARKLRQIRANRIHLATTIYFHIRTHLMIGTLYSSFMLLNGFGKNRRISTIQTGDIERFTAHVQLAHILLMRIEHKILQQMTSNLKDNYGNNRQNGNQFQVAYQYGIVCHSTW